MVRHNVEKTDAILQTLQTQLSKQGAELPSTMSSHQQHQQPRNYRTLTQKIAALAHQLSIKKNQSKRSNFELGISEIL